MEISGSIIGYDPGGNDSHGFAEIRVEHGQVLGATLHTLSTVAQVLDLMSKMQNVAALGVDTLAAWSTGTSGWRTADLWLRRRYTDIQQSIVSPNGLYGSMGINGMAVLSHARSKNAALPISETHPKVLYRALSGKKYEYQTNSGEMDRHLSKWLAVEISTANDHEWDAAVSAFAVLQGLSGLWTHDLLAVQEKINGELIWPCGPTNYWWPE